MLMLKLRWLSPTISLIREEHERCGPPTKLRLYFGGGGMRGSKESKVRQTPMSMKILSCPSNMMKSPASSTIMTKSPRIWAWTSFEPNVMIIGYGHGNGVREGGVLRLRLVMRVAMIVRRVTLAVG